MKNRTYKDSRYDQIILLVDNYAVHIHFKIGNNPILLEARHRGQIHLSGPYSANLHLPKIPSGLKHLHVYARQNQLFALNIDGTGHDGNHGFRIPNKVQKAISTKFPDFTIRNDGMIESASKAVNLIIKIQNQNDEKGDDFF